ncbi:MAG: hypothetical protein QNJ64_15330 [Crocosphaera sp.]|nr:hypothetical protein [Crocosphaera sp.]
MNNPELHQKIVKQLEQLSNEKLILVSDFIDSIKQDQSLVQKQFPVNPLTNMKPYAYVADPSEPAISPNDWEINEEFEKDD